MATEAEAPNPLAVSKPRGPCGVVVGGVVEYLLARLGRQATAARVMKLLATALYTVPDPRRSPWDWPLRIGPFAGIDDDCFCFFIYRYPVYSQVVRNTLDKLPHKPGSVKGGKRVKLYYSRRSVGEVEAEVKGAVPVVERLLMDVDAVVEAMGNWEYEGELRAFLERKLGLNYTYWGVVGMRLPVYILSITSPEKYLQWLMEKNPTVQKYHNEVEGLLKKNLLESYLATKEYLG